MGTALLRDVVAGARRRLAVEIAAVGALLLFALGGLAYGRARAAMLAAFDATHEVAARSMMEAVVVREGELVANEREFQEEFEELRGPLGVTGVSVWGANGRPLAAAGSRPRRDGPTREATSGPQATVLRRASIAVDGVGAYVVVERRADYLEADLAALRTGLLAAAPVGALVVLGAAWLLAGRALRPVRRAMETQRVFMADASHELRTPIAVVRAHAEASVGSTDPEALAASLRVIARSAEEMGHLVSDLLFLARTDAVLERHPSPVDLHELLEDVVDELAPLAAARGGALLLTSAEPLGATVDAPLVARLARALVENALVHGGGTVEVGLTRSPGLVCLTVDDAGPGIPEAERARVLTRFQRGAGSRGAPGHGLGLAIARAVTEVHGGSLTLTTSPHGGLRVLATLRG